jgi:hypothetical protein
MRGFFLHVRARPRLLISVCVGLAATGLLHDQLRGQHVLSIGPSTKIP